jgi:transforming growth factor-beta-induced protein
MNNYAFNSRFNPPMPYSTGRPDPRFYQTSASELYMHRQEYKNMPTSIQSSAPSSLSFLKDSKQFGTLLNLVNQAGLTQTLGDLEKSSPITILAPTEKAFQNLPPDIVKALTKPENKQFLQEVLKYHVTDMPITSGRPGQKIEVDSLLQDSRDATELLIGRDGKIKVDNISQMFGAAAPIINTKNGSSVIPINEVLIPKEFDTDSLLANKRNAVSFLGTNGNLSTLTQLIQGSGLTKAVQDLEKKSPKGITILAPTEEAFAKLDPRIAAALQRPENKGVLEEILKYHVSGAQVGLGGQFDSLLDNKNDRNKLVTSDGELRVVNGRQVVGVGSDVALSNKSRVITIDQVLIPPNLDLSKLLRERPTYYSV